MRAKKQFGQNFLIDNIVLGNISNTISACEDDLIIEIGPGRGALTKYLVEKGSKVLAYEIDRDLIPILNSHNYSNLKVLNKDFLESNLLEDISKYKYKDLYIVGNLPYYITTPILQHILSSLVSIKKLVVMVQLEVANRFAALPRTKDYGYFSIYLQHYYDITLITKVLPSSFSPAPKVNSAVISLVPKENILLVDNDFFDFVKLCFKEKRKTLRNNLKSYGNGNIENVLVELNLKPSIRAEEIPEIQLIKIYEKINSKENKL